MHCLARIFPVAAGLVVFASGCPGSDDGGDTEAAGSTSGPGGTTCDQFVCMTEGPDPSTASTSSTTGMAESIGADTTTSGAPATDSGGNDSTGGSDTGATGSTGDGVAEVTLETTLGDIVIQLDAAAAPTTTANFLAYVDAGFYDGTDGLDPTVFHRVIPGFMIQGGGLTETLMSKPTMPPIVNESGNGLSNVRGAIAMARTMDPDSATSQFFINVVDNPFLDNPPGYAVFGEVVEGMDIVDMIVAVPTQTVGPFDDVPVDPIFIISATVQ